jgi:hypothetical protein
MAQTAFERLIEKDLEECAQAMLRVRTTDPAVALIQGRHAALVGVLTTYRKSQRVDDDEAATPLRVA